MKGGAAASTKPWESAGATCASPTLCSSCTTRRFPSTTALRLGPGPGEPAAWWVSVWQQSQHCSRQRAPRNGAEHQGGAEEGRLPEERVSWLLRDTQEFLSTQ